MDYILIGKIINTHGLKGELKIDSYTDFEKDRFKPGSLVYVSEKYLPFTVESIKHYKGFLHIVFKDNNDINLVEKYKNMNIYKNKEDVAPLKKGEYYFNDLKGLDVYCEDICVGKVKQVEEGLRNNFLRVVKSDKTESLVPFIMNTFILDVDLDKKRIDIVKMDGLL